MSNDVAVINNTPALPATAADNRGIFSNISAFEDAQRMATALATSQLVPEAYRGPNGVGSALIALDMAGRVNASPMMVMQNLDIIHGRPSWRSQFIIAALNSCGRFSPLRYVVTGDGDDKGCTAWAEDKSGERLEGPEVTMKMAKAEGWYDKKGSKWKTMPDLMLRYRAAAFFGRLYAPDVLMGMPSADETLDLGPDEYTVVESKVVPTIADASDAEKAESESPKKRSRVTKAQLAEAQKDGVSAYHADVPLSDCPEDLTSTALRNAWAAGWQEAEAETPVDRGNPDVTDEDTPETTDDAPFDLDEDGEPANEDSGQAGQPGDEKAPPLVDDGGSETNFGFSGA